MRFNPDDYVDVSDRITRFWNEYPDGAIRTELASPASSFTEVVFRAEVYKHRENAHPDAVGYAAEKPGNGANQTSWHENCETSAIGRALANMGYATSQKERPSKQEMQKVNRAQPQPAPMREQMAVAAQNGPPMSDRQRGFLISLAKELGMVSDNGHHDAAALDAETMQLVGVKADQLSVGKAKEVIDEFVIRRDAARANGGIPEPHPMVQQAMENSTANWIAAMEGAATMAELSKKANEALAANAMTDPVRATFNKRRDQLQERSLIGAN